MNGLTWWQARELAKAGREVRREAWAAGRWLSWRHNIAYQRAGTSAPAPVVAADVEPAHFTARDWTDEGAATEPPYVAELLIESLGPQDDDLRVTVGGVVVSDTRWNSGWYSDDGEHGREYPAGVFPPAIPPWPTITASSWRKIRITATQAEALGLRMVSGMEVEVDVFDGWASEWRASPWRATVTWSDGTVDTHNGGWYSYGRSSGIYTPQPYFEIDLYAALPSKDLAGQSLYGAKTFGPYALPVMVSSHASNPASADDTLVINGVKIDPRESWPGAEYAHVLFDGVTTDILVLPQGQPLVVDVWNTGGWCGASGALRVEPLYYSSPAHFAEYHPDGSFVL